MENVCCLYNKISMAETGRAPIKFALVILGLSGCNFFTALYILYNNYLFVLDYSHLFVDETLSSFCHITLKISKRLILK